MNTKLDDLTLAICAAYPAAVAGKQPATGLGGPVQAAMSRDSVLQSGFFASGVSSMGGPDGRAARLAGACPVRQSRSVPPTPAWRLGSGSQNELEQASMIAIAQGAPAPTIFQFRTTEVRTLVIEGEVWFVASDVAKALGYPEAKDMTRVLDEDEKGRQIVPTLGGDQEMNVINESGLYHAVLKSRKPEARPFRKWVTSEVLPTIRKTGQYVAQPYAQNPNDRLTIEQADILRNMLTDAAKARHPGDGKKQGAFMMRGWSKLKAHFKVGYREIPQGEFAEAVSLVARHVADQGELLDAAPAADMVSKSHALRCLKMTATSLFEAQQSVLSDLLDMDEMTIKHGRVIVTMDWEGRRAVAKALPDDAMVMTWPQVAGLIREPGFAPSSGELLAIASACTGALASRIA